MLPSGVRAEAGSPAGDWQVYKGERMVAGTSVVTVDGGGEEKWLDCGCILQVKLPELLPDLGVGWEKRRTLVRLVPFQLERPDRRCYHLLTWGSWEKG